MEINYSKQKRQQTANGISAEQWKGMNTHTVEATEKPDFNKWAEGLKKESEKVDLKLTGQQIQLCLDALREHRHTLSKMLDHNIGIDAKTSLLARMTELDGLIFTINV